MNKVISDMHKISVFCVAEDSYNVADKNTIFLRIFYLSPILHGIRLGHFNTLPG